MAHHNGLGPVYTVLMKTTRFRLAWTLGTALAAASPLRAANVYQAIAQELSDKAASKGMRSVAVLPFSPTDGSAPSEGSNISEKLVTQLVRAGKVKLVERSHLRKIMDEHYLARTGAVDQARQIGKVLSVDAVITGSFFASRDGVGIHSRLIAVETGLILAAREDRAERDWAVADKDAVAKASPLRGGARSVPIPGFSVGIPELTVPVPELVGDDETLRDAVADLDCADAAARVDRIEESILELKARYWAMQIRSGEGLRKAKANPGSTISDPALKARFYRRMKDYHAAPATLDLTADELRRFKEADERAFRLHHDCGI